MLLEERTSGALGAGLTIGAKLRKKPTGIREGRRRFYGLEKTMKSITDPLWRK